MHIRLLSATIVGGALTLLSAPPANAAPPEFPHGAGVCLSQVAINPALLGASSLGQVVSAVANTGPRSLPASIDSLRGDGPTGCGAPPGPHATGA